MAWYENSVFYHIYPLGMLGAEKENDYKTVTHRLPELNKWMPYFKELGINAIYIGPLFESVGHGYETTDYKKLDGRLGDNKDLKEFVANCHKEGIKVIFDGVFNHVGRDFFAFKDLKEKRESSAYKDWFLNVNFWGNNEYNDGFSYDNWGGYNLLVKLNQRNPAVRDYILDVIRFWVSEFDVDGIRLDAADVLDFDFMKSLRGLANVVKPDFWLMGEVIHGDYTRWANDGTLHSVTNYTLHKALYSGHNEHNYFEIAHTVNRLNDMGLNRPDGLKLYNFVDNHDVERIYTKLTNKANYYPVHVLLFTLPGIPSIYYGSEMGIEGKKEKFSDASLRPALDLDKCMGELKTNKCIELNKRLCEVRRANPVLAHGDYKQVVLTNRQYAFTRNTADETALVVVNNDENGANISGGGVRDGEYIGMLSGNKLTICGGGFSVNLPANSGDIYVQAGDKKTSKSLEGVGFTVDKPAAVTKEETPKVEDIKVEAVRETVEAKNEAVNEKIVENNDDANKIADGAKKPVKEDKPNKGSEKKAINSASDKFNLEAKYESIDTEEIKSRSDYDSMSIEELQVAILMKMAGNGPVNDQMIKTVMDNVYPDSLKNWVKSFR